MDLFVLLLIISSHIKEVNGGLDSRLTFAQHEETNKKTRRIRVTGLTCSVSHIYQKNQNVYFSDVAQVHSHLPGYDKNLYSM